MNLTHLDLCSGIGGFALAARWAEIETIGFCEVDNFCRQVLKKHWPTVEIHWDVKTLDYELYRDKVSILTAGFPCQPFSVAGKQKGVEDERHLWPWILGAIKDVRPTWAIFENVPGIVSYLDQICKDLENEDYETTAIVLPASLVGAPHKRERIWIIANSHSKRCYDGFHCGKIRQLHNNIDWHIEKIQSQWPQFQSESWAAFNAQEWLDGKSKQHQPPVSRMDDGVSNRVDRIKALGNSIVPHVAFIFMSIIKEIETHVSC